MVCCFVMNLQNCELKNKLWMNHQWRSWPFIKTRMLQQVTVTYCKLYRVSSWCHTHPLFQRFLSLHFHWQFGLVFCPPCQSSLVLKTWGDTWCQMGLPHLPTAALKPVHTHNKTNVLVFPHWHQHPDLRMRY